MEAKAESLPSPAGPPKRKLRNFLLDRRFQLKYTGMVVAVTVLVAAILGYLAYDYSRGQTQALTIQIAMQPDLNPEVASDLQGFAEAHDRKVLLGILGGILLMTVALGVTGVVVTHRLVGPAYKIKRLLGEVADGQLRVEGGLRKGDELKDVFDSFARMVESLRRRQTIEIEELDATISRARQDGASAQLVAELTALRDRMQKSLE